MTNAEKKARFIQMKAEGESYSTIAQALSISKATCTRWNKELESSITPQEQETLTELQEQYNGTKQARIKAYGQSLQRISQALEIADLTAVAPDKLLELQLKYIKALQAENVPQNQRPELKATNLTVNDIIGALEATRTALQSGDITIEQAREETAILTAELKAIEKKQAQSSGYYIEPIVLTDEINLDEI